MRQSDPDLLALVLEDEDKLHLGPISQLFESIRPNVHELLDLFHRHERQLGVVIAGVDDDFANALRRPNGTQLAALNARDGWISRQARESILEDHDIVVLGGNLGRKRAGLRWAE